jgi:hypothetical protein
MICEVLPPDGNARLTRRAAGKDSATGRRRRSSGYSGPAPVENDTFNLGIEANELEKLANRRMP